MTSWICLLGTVEGGIVALIMERGNPSIWALNWDKKLLAAVYSVSFLRFYRTMPPSPSHRRARVHTLPTKTKAKIKPLGQWPTLKMMHISLIEIRRESKIVTKNNTDIQRLV